MTDAERAWLERIRRSQHERASQVASATQLLNVAHGCSYQDAACLAGRPAGDAVSTLVTRCNREGLNALHPRHGGGPATKYGPAARERMRQEVRRQPAPETDGTAPWSLKPLCQALRKAPDDMPAGSEETIRSVLRAAGFRWQEARSWGETGQVPRRRTRGQVTVTDPEAMAQKP